MAEVEGTVVLEVEAMVEEVVVDMTLVVLSGELAVMAAEVRVTVRMMAQLEEMRKVMEVKVQLMTMVMMAGHGGDASGGAGQGGGDSGGGDSAGEGGQGAGDDDGAGD